MKKMNTSPISGTQELLPVAQATFNNLKAKIAASFRAHGFFPIETPLIDRTEILLAKAGGDTEKQIYKVIKTAETADAADQALRFDHTVPLARYVVEHENDLAFPFKVTQIGRNYRGERAQKGRFREFYQCDVDVIGRNNLPLAYDAEVILTLMSALKSFNLDTPILARISNRKILSGLLEALNLTEKSADIFSIIDHSEKVPAEKTTQDLESIGLSASHIDIITKFIDIHGNHDTVIPALKSLNIANPTFEQGIAELSQVLSLTDLGNPALSLSDASASSASSISSLVHPSSPTSPASPALTGQAPNQTALDSAISDISAPHLSPSSSIIADLRIVRGLDYYTGTVFEFNLPEHRSLGSIAGGGRYENLANYFTDQSLPGVGGSIGLTRLFYVLTENNLIKSQEDAPLDYAIIPVSLAETSFAFALAEKLRATNSTVDVVLTDKKLGDKIAYAAKLAKSGIILGEDEIKSGRFKVKNFITGEISDLNYNH